MNLIKNSLKFTRRGHIEIKAEYNDTVQPTPELLVEISDNGAGIHANDMNQLFTRFGKL